MTNNSNISSGDFTDLEKERLVLFREQCENLDGLSEEQKEDHQLVRWLRARNMDIEKAYKMLELSLEWRKENKLDGILEREELPQDFKDTLPVAVLGVDKDGHLLMVNPMGRHDIRSLVEKYGVEECFRIQLLNMEMFMEIFRQKSKEIGRPVTKCVQICDFEGYSIRQFTSKACREFMVRGNKAVEANYPDLIHSVIVVNAPKIFGLLFNFLKPFMPKETIEKIDVYGPDPEKWKKVVADKVPLEFVPEHWGGTRKGSDEYCSKDDIWVYGLVPISFFTGNKVEVDDKNMTKVNISARGTHKVTLDVTKPNSSIAWRFRSDNHDIGFQITCPQGDKGEVLLPFNRVQSQKELQEGTQLCKEIGRYNFLFDNTYSMYRSKTIYYNISVIEPTEENVKN